MTNSLNAKYVLSDFAGSKLKTFKNNYVEVLKSYGHPD